MNLNPEFQRQLQLEFSQARLIGVPLVLSVIFALTYLTDDYQFADNTARTAIGLFLLIVSFWGARQAVDSVLDEQRAHTWDTQRLSALDPWTMVIGKLFGSTLVVWYGGAICLAVYALAAKQLSNFIWVFSFAIISGLFIQSLSLMMSLLGLRKDYMSSNSVIIGFAIFAAFFSAVWIMPLAEPNALKDTNTGDWYGINSSVIFLILISLIWALFWCMVGNYRLMEQELRIRTLPWTWLSFAVFLMVYFGGFLPNDHFIESFLVLSFSICLFLTYLAALSEVQEPMRVKRLLTYIEQENWRRSGEELPLWCLSFVLAFVFAVPLALLDLHDIEDKDVHIYPLTILLMSLRDIGVFLYYSYSKNPQRAFSLTLLTLIILYGIFPGIFTAMKLEGMVAIFFPLIAKNAFLAIIYSVLQTGLVAWLVYKRWLESV
ncbi:hypothetical protein DOJK_01060 [Patescibacteria group bacterium]|nr:hypothetical protein DOJK_01060 [Patescibacteria group bacterium]